MWAAFYLFSFLTKHCTPPAYTSSVCEAGFACFLCPLEVYRPSPLFPDLSLHATHAFVSHYASYYGIFHLVWNSKWVINPCNKTMRQIDLVIEHITGRSKVFIIIFFNIEYLLNLYYIYIRHSENITGAPTLPLPSRSIYFKHEPPKSHIIELSVPFCATPPIYPIK